MRMTTFFVLSLAITLALGMLLVPAIGIVAFAENMTGMTGNMNGMGDNMSGMTGNMTGNMTGMTGNLTGQKGYYLLIRHTTTSDDDYTKIRILPISFCNFVNWNLRSNMAQAIAFNSYQSLTIGDK